MDCYNVSGERRGRSQSATGRPGRACACRKDPADGKYAAERATWPDTALTLAVPGGNTYAQLTRERVLAAAEELRIPVAVARRELDRICRNILPTADEVLAQMEWEDAALPAEHAATLAAERRILNGCRHSVLPEMLAEISGQREHSGRYRAQSSQGEGME